MEGAPLGLEEIGQSVRNRQLECLQAVALRGVDICRGNGVDIAVHM
jgi:hypothetical protein